MPHILRGVNLLGVSSANSPMKLRRDLWGDLFADKSFMQALTKIEKQVIGLEQVPELCQDILQAKHSGRSIVSFLD